jgi:hypothetical protein
MAVGYLEVLTADRLELGYADTQTSIVITDTNIDASTIACKTTLGANDAFTITPYQASAYIHYDIPAHILCDYVSISTLQNCLLDEFRGRDVAIVNTCAYIDNCIMSPDGILSNRILSTLDASYIAKDVDGDKIPEAYILNTDFSNARISTLTDTNGNPLSITNAFQSTMDRLQNVEGNIVDYTSSYNSVVTNQDLLVDKIDCLGTCIGGFSTSLSSVDGIFAGVQREWSSSHPLWTINGEANPPIGVLCFNNNTTYRFAGSAIGWLPLDNGACTYVDTCINTAVVPIGELASDAKYLANRKVISCSVSPSIASLKKYDIWVDTTTTYPVSIGEIDPKLHKIKLFNGTILGASDDAANVSTDYATCGCAKSIIGWAAYSEKLIKGSNGAITGWSMYDGSDSSSVFKIAANCFILTNGESTTDNAAFSSAFTVVSDGIQGHPNKIKFNGVVDFTNTDTSPFTVSPTFGTSYNVTFEGVDPSLYSGNITKVDTTVTGMTASAGDIDGKYALVTASNSTSYINASQVNVCGFENPTIRLIVCSNLASFKGNIEYTTECYDAASGLFVTNATGSKVTTLTTDQCNRWVSLDIPMTGAWRSVNTRIKNVKFSLVNSGSSIKIKSIDIGGGVTNTGAKANSDMSNVTTISGGKISTNELVFGGTLKETNGTWKPGASGMYLDKDGISILSSGVERIRIGKLF